MPACFQRSCWYSSCNTAANSKCRHHVVQHVQVAAQEAMGAEQTVVAKQALLQLWDMVDTDSNGTFQPGAQTVILSNLVKITQDNQSGNGELRYLPPARQSGRKGLLACKLTACRADVSSYMDGLSAIYKQGADRLQEIGYDGFFGADTNGRCAGVITHISHGVGCKAVVDSVAEWTWAHPRRSDVQSSE